MGDRGAAEWGHSGTLRDLGGEAKQVTIFGESAGAGMVANLMTIPSAKGLFVRALGESAWSTAKIAPLSTLADGELEGVKLADGVGAKSLAKTACGKRGGSYSEGRTRHGGRWWTDG